MSEQYPSPFGGQPGGGFPQGGFQPQSGGGFPQGGGGPGPGFPGGGGPAPRPQAPAPAPAPAPATRSAKKGKEKKTKDAKDTKPVTRRVVNRQFLLAGVFALAAGVAVTSFLTSSEEMTYVVRAKADIAAGTQVSSSLLEAVAIPTEFVEPGTLTAKSEEGALKKAKDELADVVSQYPLAARTQIRPNQFGLQATLGAELQPGERLVSIHASVSTAVAGNLQVGDTVDVVGAVDGWTKVVATSVPIVQIAPSEDLYASVADAQTTDRNVNPDDLIPGDPVPALYVVKVPADLVPALLNWDQSATLSLVYRSPDATDGANADNFLNDDAAQAAQIGSGQN